MNKEEHIKRHKELHDSLDELVADLIGHTGKLPSRITLFEFMAWSYTQTLEPNGEHADSPTDGFS